MATTTNYGWTTPDDTALVKDGAAAIRTLGSSVDTTTKNLNPETTLGDLAYRSSTANVKTRLALGTANQQLRVNSGATAPEWFTPSASGGMTLISETTASALSSLSFSSLGSYKQLLLEWHNIYHSNNSTRFDLRFNSDANANYLGANFTADDGTFTARSAPADTAVSFYAAFGQNTNNNPSAYVFNSYGSLLIDNYTSSTKFKKFKIIHWHYNDPDGYIQQVYADRYYISTSAITSLDVVRTSGTGTFSNQGDSSIRLYGIS